MSNFWALVHILKALVDLSMFLSGKISRMEYHRRLDLMEAAIKKATEGKLNERLEGGQLAEDLFNDRTSRR